MLPVSDEVRKGRPTPVLRPQTGTTRHLLLSVDTRSTRRSTRIIFPTKIHVLLSVDTRSTPTCGASLWPCLCASSMRRSGPWWDVCCARAARQRRCASLRRQQWQPPHHSHRSARWLPAWQATHSLPASWTSPRRSLSSACTLMMVTMAKYRMLSSQARANSGQHRTHAMNLTAPPGYPKNGLNGAIPSGFCARHRSSHLV